MPQSNKHLLKWLWKLLTRRKHEAVCIRFIVRALDDNSVRLTWNGERMMLLLRDDQKVSLSIQPLDAKGSPAKVDGVPQWNNSDSTLGTLTPASDGMSAVFVATAMGTVQVSVTVDADLGSGVRNVSGTLDIQIEPGEAVSIGIVAGTPEAQ